MVFSAILADWPLSLPDFATLHLGPERIGVGDSHFGDSTIPLAYPGTRSASRLLRSRKGVV
jgi:hypothetical protein